MWVGLTVGYQFNDRRRFMSGNASLQRFWREGNTNSFNLQGSGSWQPNERTDLSTALNYSSNTSFERNRQVDPFRQLSDISSTVPFRRQTDWGTITSGGELRQAISTGDNNLRTRLSLSPNTITLFPVGEDGRERWYSEGSLTIQSDASVNRTQPGEALARRQQPSEDDDASLSGSVRLGNVGVAGGLRYSRSAKDELAAVDSIAAIGNTTPAQRAFLPGFGTQTLDWNASTGYEFRLIGATRLTPSISIGQQVVRRDTAFTGGEAPDSVDTGRYGAFVAAPMRTSLSATCRRSCSASFPGFGGYSAIRHHFRPSVAYRYSPEVRQTPQQELVFGQQGGREQNDLTLTLDQTLEAKRRAPRRESAVDQGAERAGTGNPQGAGEANPGAQTDTAAAQLTPGDPTLRDTTGAESAGGRPSGGAGQQDEQDHAAVHPHVGAGVQLRAGGHLRHALHDAGHQQPHSSDLFGGLNFTISHDLFADERGDTGASGGIGRRGRFSPFLTGVQTSAELRGQLGALPLAGLCAGLGGGAPDGAGADAAGAGLAHAGHAGLADADQLARSGLRPAGGQRRVERAAELLAAAHAPAHGRRPHAADGREPAAVREPDVHAHAQLGGELVHGLQHQRERVRHARAELQARPVPLAGQLRLPPRAERQHVVLVLRAPDGPAGPEGRLQPLQPGSRPAGPGAVGEYGSTEVREYGSA